MKFTIATILASAAYVLASPMPDVAVTSAPSGTVTGTEGTISPSEFGTANGGALALATGAPAPTPASPSGGVADTDGGSDIAKPPKYLTIEVVNKHGVAVSTSHARAANAPTPVSGNVGAGVLKDGASASFAVPTGWAGNIAIVDSSHKITGDDSLIEASFVKPQGYNVAVADVDISYVNGFSVPIVCSCKVKSKQQVVSGCNKNLFSLGSCPKNDGQGACVNPERADSGATSAAPFFKPCQSKAYTFPNDNKANSFGQCQEGHITCCIGTKCSANN